MKKNLFCTDKNCVSSNLFKINYTKNFIHETKEEFISIIKKENIGHYNRWLSDCIQSYMKDLDDSIRALFQPYVSFETMPKLFGLGNNFFLNVRRETKSKHVVASSILEIMRRNLEKKTNSWINKYPSLKEMLLKVQIDIIRFIDEYANLFEPVPTPNYQMYRYHPNFNRNYFTIITTKEQAYWLGFLIADGYISIEHKKSGDYHRMGILLSRKDKGILLKFCKAIGLNPEYIKDTECSSDFSSKKYLVSYIRWGDQKFAQDLIKLGMEYKYDENKGRRVKIPVLPGLNRTLMLAFLLGFFDGDGTLRLSEYKRVSPAIYSSNENFLIEIKRYFNLNQDVHSRIIERINPRRGLLVRTPYNRLSVGPILFEEMMNNYDNSLERKRVDKGYYEDYFYGGEKAKIHFDQKNWLKNVIEKEALRKILEYLSPYRISKILGISRLSIIRVAEEYNVKYDFNGGHYIIISNSIHNYGKESDYYESQQIWLNYLVNIGKFHAI